jgi:transposase
MTVTVHEASKPLKPRELIRTKSNAKQRDRFRAALLAIEGEPGVELEGDQIALRLGRPPRFVDQWLAHYRRGGLAAPYPKKAKGRPKKLPTEREQAFIRWGARRRPMAESARCVGLRRCGFSRGSSGWR